MKAKHLLLILCLIIPAIAAARAEGKNNCYLNINKYNGLPSNHAYYVLTDRMGYLWIATDRGVVRYNGYECKIYGHSSGMANSDVWFLFEDIKGRMWCASISNEIGYFLNDQYKRAYVNDSSPPIYPFQFWQFGNDVCFSSIYITDRKKWKIYIEHENTLEVHTLNGQPILTSTGLFTVFGDSLYREYVKNAVIEQAYICNTGEEAIPKLPPYNNLDSLLFYFYPNTNTLHIINTNTYAKIKMQFGNEHLFTAYGISGKLFVTTDSSFYIYDSHLHCIDKYPFSNLFGIVKTANNMLSISYDSGWKNCISTANNGVFIDYGKKHPFSRPLSDMLNYVCVGAVDQSSFWWNKMKRTIAKVDGNNRISYYECPTITDVNKIIPFHNDTSLLIAASSVYFCNFSKPGAWVIDTLQDVRDLPNTNLILCGDSVVALNNAYGIRMFPIHPSYTIGRNIYSYRFKNIVYDSIHQAIWAYGYNRIAIYKPGYGVYVLKKDLLQSIGLLDVQKILIDKKSGNIFFQSYNRLIVYNFYTHAYRDLFRDYVLTNTAICLYHNMLVVAGKFGVIFSKMGKDGDMEDPVLLENIKDASYEYVTDIAAHGNCLLLNTDKGLYKPGIPTDSNTPRPIRIAHLYKFNLTYNNHVKTITAGDTLQINQDDRKLHFDIVNPGGNGTLQYSYRIDELDYKWTALSTNELYLPKLTAGRHYTLLVIGQDDIWRSKPIKLHLYLVPYWWQRATIWPLVVLAAIISIIALFATAIYFTRRIVISNNIKKNMRMELELKSIYAQINPHFIFNTLNSVSYFIRTNKSNQAYSYLTKFSSLLRAYIKSSRNQLISIGEEINNMTNYLELQQARFVDKFDYDIVLDDTLSASTMIPSLLLQPIVENAIQHGIIPMKEKGHLQISFKKIAADEIIIVIGDNGIGREQSKLQNQDNHIIKDSYGTQLIDDLVKIFNKYEHMTIKMKYVDKTLPDTGTLVEIKIKYT